MKNIIEFTINGLFLIVTLLIMYVSKAPVSGEDLQDNRLVKARYEMWNSPFSNYVPLPINNNVFTIVNGKVYVIESSYLHNRFLSFEYRDFFYQCLVLFFLFLAGGILLMIILSLLKYYDNI